MLWVSWSQSNRMTGNATEYAHELHSPGIWGSKIEFREDGEVVGGVGGEFGLEDVAAFEVGGEVGGDEEVVDTGGGVGGGEGGLEVFGGVVEGVGVEVALFEDGADGVAGDFVVLPGEAVLGFLAELGEVDDLLGVIGVEVAGEEVGAAVEEFGDVEESGEFGESDGFVGEGFAGVEVEADDWQVLSLES